MTFRLSSRLGFVNNNASRLTSRTNKYLLKYNGTSGEFDLVSPDELITSSTTDDDGTLPDQFIDQVEAQIDVAQIARTYDGGSF